MNDSKLEILIKPLIKIYEELELELIKDIAIRLNTYTGIEGSLKWYLDKLQEIGGFNKENLALLAEYAGKSQREVKEILRYAGYDVSKLDKYREYIDEESLLNNPTQLYESVAVQNIINNSIKETNSIMETIQTKALESAKESYMKILTEAHVGVSGGIYSYDQAIKKALNKMAKEGFTGATYKNGKRLTLESTVRRDILTKVHQLAGDIQIEKAKQLKTNLVYVTQHLGARIRTKYTKEDYEVHYEWQGKVYMLEGSSDKYDNFYEKTGYGKLLGLCGVNCRHNFFPTFEGRSHPKLYDEEENEKEYIKQQKQRGYERQYRSLKYQKEVARILDDKEQLKKLNPQIREFNKEYNQFLEENNLQRDYSREYIEKEIIKIDNKNNWFKKLTKQEQIDLKEYISSGSYKINESLYNHRELTEEQIRFRDSLDSALTKAPKYQGYVNRSIEVNNQEQLNHILSIFNNDNRTGCWGSYISSSKGIYDENMKVQMKIKSKNGRDLSSLNNEGGGEILFERQTKFKYIDLKKKDGKIYISLEEIE